METYYTVKQSGKHEVIIQKSRFIGHVSRVHNEAEAQSFIQKIKREHYNATHNCFAYITGEQNQFQKANDDGEPSGTAGIPMLEVLKRLSLTNTAIVITRYYGGTKLGAGGLIRAYSSVTSETVKHIGIVKGEQMQGYSLHIDYPLLGKVENYLSNSTSLIEHVNYSDTVELIVFVHIKNSDQFIEKITNLTSGNVSIDKTEIRYIEIDVDF